MKSGGRTRLSTLAAGVFLLILVFVLGPVVSLIPMAALNAVTAKFAARGIEAEIIGLNPDSEHLHTKLSGQLTGSH